MRIAIFSPLNPVKSGISEYTEELLPYLSRYYDIDLFIDQDRVGNSITSVYNVFTADEISNRYNDYDFLLYNIGNNYGYHKKIYQYALTYPGIVVLHDYSLHNFFLGGLTEKKRLADYPLLIKNVYGDDMALLAKLSLEGEYRPPLWETEIVLEKPLNHELINFSKYTLVHSQFIFSSVKNSPYSFGDVGYLPFPCNNVKKTNQFQINEFREKYNISVNTIVISTFGFVTRAKRIESIFNVLGRIKTDGMENFVFIIIGQIIDGNIDIEILTKKYGLHGNIKHLGYVSLEEFEDYIQVSDICLNLRFPTMGETSASLFRIMGYGKPVIVSDCGSFSDLPDNVLCKVTTGAGEIDELYYYIFLLMTDKLKRENMSEAAYQFVKKNHSIDKTIEQYKRHIDEIMYVDALDDSVERLNSIFQDFGLDKSSDAVFKITKIISDFIDI